MRMNWIFEGRCWKLGDNVPNDGGLMEMKFMGQMLEYDPAKLAPHALARLRPEFGGQARPGDVLVAGIRFCYGNPHIQGALGLKGLQVAVVVEGLQRTSYRLLISAGVPFLPYAKGVLALVEDGDRVRVNIETGEFANLSNGKKAKYEPLPAFLLEVIAAGGTTEHLRQRLQLEGRVHS